MKINSLIPASLLQPAFKLHELGQNRVSVSSTTEKVHEVVINQKIEKENHPNNQSFGSSATCSEDASVNKQKIEKENNPNNQSCGSSATCSEDSSVRETEQEDEEEDTVGETQADRMETLEYLTRESDLVDQPSRYFGMMGGYETRYEDAYGQLTYGRKFYSHHDIFDIRPYITALTVFSISEFIKVLLNSKSFFNNLRSINSVDEAFRAKNLFVFENAWKLKDFPLEDPEFRCFGYALRWMGPQLVRMIQMTQEKPKTINEVQRDIQAITDSNEVQNIISRFFNPVSSPQDGDLVVYRGYDLEGKFFSILHAGIYRRTRHGEKVESKGGVFPFAFLHDIFAIPDFYGNAAYFYRLKTDGLGIQQGYSTSFTSQGYSTSFTHLDSDKIYVMKELTQEDLKLLK